MSPSALRRYVNYVADFALQDFPGRCLEASLASLANCDSDCAINNEGAASRLQFAGGRSEKCRKVNIGMLGALGTLGFSQLISRILDEIVGIGQSFLPCTGIVALDLQPSNIMKQPRSCLQSSSPHRSKCFHFTLLTSVG